MAETEARELDAEAIIRRVKEQMPEVTVEQISVYHPSDYEYLWMFYLPNNRFCLQIEGPNCPVLLDADTIVRAKTVDEAVLMITTYIRDMIEGKPEPIEWKAETY